MPKSKNKYAVNLIFLYNLRRETPVRIAHLWKLMQTTRTMPPARLEPDWAYAELWLLRHFQAQNWNDTEKLKNLPDHPQAAVFADCVWLGLSFALSLMRLKALVSPESRALGLLFHSRQDPCLMS